ncbi:MAG: hypothetical protein M5U25_06210 [Planctomycetota bacterium]|nr:hypothetical protein [Planctomycetota bacterium]
MDIPAEEDETAAEESLEDNELSLDEPAEEVAAEVSAEVAEEEAEPEPETTVAAPPPAGEKTGVRIPRNRKLKRPKLKPKSGGVGPGTRTIPAPVAKVAPPPPPSPWSRRRPQKPPRPGRPRKRLRPSHRCRRWPSRT